MSFQTNPVISLLIALIFIPGVYAGSPTQPEVVDATGEVSIAALDIQKLWITNSERWVQIHIQVRDLAAHDPIFTSGHYRYAYHVKFDVTGSPYPGNFAEGTLWYVDSSSKHELQPWGYQCSPSCLGYGVGTGIGSAYTGHQYNKHPAELAKSNSIKLYPNQNLVVIEIAKDSLLPTGSFITNIVVKTYLGTTPVTGPFMEAVAGPERTLIDTAGPGTAYKLV